MRKSARALVLGLAMVSAVNTLSAVGCGSSSGPAEIKTYPPVTPEEEKVIAENMESAKDEH